MIGKIIKYILIALGGAIVGNLIAIGLMEVFK